MNYRKALSYVLCLAALVSFVAACKISSSDDSEDPGATGEAPVDAAAPSPGTAISFSGTSGSATTLSWGAASDKVTAKAKLQYKVVEASSADAIDTVAEAKAIGTPAQGLVMDWKADTLTASASGLSEGTEYYFAVLVKDKAGNVGIYAPKSVATLIVPDTVAPIPGAGISFSGLGATAVTVDWGAASDDVTPVSSLQYKVVRASASAAIDTVAEADAITTSAGGLVKDWTAGMTGVEAAGLSETTAYYFAVLAKDAAGNMSLYAPALIITPDGTAPKIGTAIAFSRTDYNCATAGWGAASDNVTAAASLQYKVLRASTSAAIDTVAEAAAITTAASGLAMDWAANVTSLAASGLSGSATYYFAVLVRDATGNMSLYSPTSVTTLATPVARYEFEGSGRDSVGSHDLTSSVSYSSTIKKQGSWSGNFDGTHVAYNTNLSINVPSGITMSVWINFRTDANCNSIVTYSSGSVPGYFQCLAFNNTSNPMTELCLCDTMDLAACSTSIASGAWYLCAFTVDTSGNVKMYVNGRVLADSDASPNLVVQYLPVISGLQIGETDGYFMWDGYIDDLRIYDKVMSPAEVAALYASY